MSLITEHRDFLSLEELQELWARCVCTDNWNFGQKSNDNTVYPMWFQGYYNTFKAEYKEGIPDLIKQIDNRFLDLCGDEYSLVRSMMAGNTYGQDGDIHDDWPRIGESLTGVIYLNRRWEDNWGGETIIYDREDTTRAEISKFEAGKLIVFDGANPHIGKGPQRNCGELRSILAVQAVKTEAWQEHLDKMRKKS